MSAVGSAPQKLADLGGVAPIQEGSPPRRPRRILLTVSAMPISKQHADGSFCIQSSRVTGGGCSITYLAYLRGLASNAAQVSAAEIRSFSDSVTPCPAWGEGGVSGPAPGQATCGHPWRLDSAFGVAALG